MCALSMIISRRTNLMSHVVEARHESPEAKAVRSDWDRAEAEALYALPFADLMFRAQSIHRAHFDPNHVETASLLSIKTGGCPGHVGSWAQRPPYDPGLATTRPIDQGSGVVTAAPHDSDRGKRCCLSR